MLDTYEITYCGVTMEIVAHYYKGDDDQWNPSELEAHEIRVEGVDIQDLLSTDTVTDIENRIMEKYEL